MTVPRQTYTLYAANGRVYATNIAQKLIDLGSLTHRKDAGFRYRLDGNQMEGHGFASEKEALHDIGNKVLFLFMDGQFTALADARGSVKLDGAPWLEITLDELPLAAAAA